MSEKIIDKSHKELTSMEIGANIITSGVILILLGWKLSIIYLLCMFSFKVMFIKTFRDIANKK